MKSEWKSRSGSGREDLFYQVNLKIIYIIKTDENYIILIFFQPEIDHYFCEVIKRSLFSVHTSIPLSWLHKKRWYHFLEELYLAIFTWSWYHFCKAYAIRGFSHLSLKGFEMSSSIRQGFSQVVYEFFCLAVFIFNQFECFFKSHGTWSEQWITFRDARVLGLLQRAEHSRCSARRERS